MCSHMPVCLFTQGNTSPGSFRPPVILMCMGPPVILICILLANCSGQGEAAMSMRPESIDKHYLLPGVCWQNPNSSPLKVAAATQPPVFCLSRSQVAVQERMISAWVHYYRVVPTTLSRFINPKEVFSTQLFHRQSVCVVSERGFGFHAYVRVSADESTVATVHPCGPGPE